jgi:hypothetical protein
METGEAIAKLLAAGIRLRPAGPDRLRTAEGQLVSVRNWKRTPAAGTLRADADARSDDDLVLYVVDRVSDALGTVARSDARTAVVSPDEIWFRTRRLGPDDEPERVPQPSKGPRPYGRFAVARALLTGETFTQQELARLIGISQPAVSYALHHLGSMVARSSLGWSAAEPTLLAEHATDEYPGPGGITTYWWHDSPLEAQYDLVANVAETLLSGDLAARRISAWRVPEHVVLYTNDEVDPEMLGFSLASADDYTLELTLPADQTLPKTAALFGRPGIADPVIVARDVRRTGTTGDEGEAAERIVKTVAA